MISTKITVNDDFQSGDLVESKNSNTIILVCRIVDDCFFKGVVVYSENGRYAVGYASSTWDKSVFTMFKGELNLKN